MHCPLGRVHAAIGDWAGSNCGEGGTNDFAGRYRVGTLMCLRRWHLGGSGLPSSSRRYLWTIGFDSEDGCYDYAHQGDGAAYGGTPLGGGGIALGKRCACGCGASIPMHCPLRCVNEANGGWLGSNCGEGCFGGPCTDSMSNFGCQSAQRNAASACVESAYLLCLPAGATLSFRFPATWTVYSGLGTARWSLCLCTPGPRCDIRITEATVQHQWR